jgi:putative endonuclease
MRCYFVYILANSSRTLYTGATNNMMVRLYQHKTATSGFVARYGCTRLVYLESTPSPRAAIDRETQIKKWRRAKKISLITSINPAWDDLAISMGLVP